MKKTVEILKVNQECFADFVKNSKGKGKPVARIEGIVAFIDDSVKTFIAPGSTWMVRIVDVHEKHLIVEPIIKIRTPKQNDILLREKLQQFAKKKEKQKKQKKVFQYMSANEKKEMI